jgi:hypothetical protein
MPAARLRDGTTFASMQFSKSCANTPQVLTATGLQMIPNLTGTIWNTDAAKVFEKNAALP